LIVASGFLASAFVLPAGALTGDAPVPLPKPAAVQHAAIDPEAMAAKPNIPDFVDPTPAAPAEPAGSAEGQTRDRPTPSGLPVPRFVSLKSGEVYLREGPSAEHKVE